VWGLKFQLIARGLSGCIVTACTAYLTGIAALSAAAAAEVVCLVAGMCAAYMCWCVHLQSGRWVWGACIRAGDALMACMSMYMI